MTSKVFSEMEEVIKITIRKINEINRSDDANGKRGSYVLIKVNDTKPTVSPNILI